MDGELEDIINCSFINLTCSLKTRYLEGPNLALLLVSIHRN